MKCYMLYTLCSKHSVISVAMPRSLRMGFPCNSMLDTTSFHGNQEALKQHIWNVFKIRRSSPLLRVQIL